MQHTEYITAKQAADILKVSESTFCRAARAGLVAGGIRIGNRVVYAREVINKLTLPIRRPGRKGRSNQ